MNTNQALPQLNVSQKQALDHILDFINSENDCFILSGSAGTGKTTLTAQLLQKLKQRGIFPQLACPTGRAARILRQKTSEHASTIHSMLYNMEDLIVYDEQGNLIKNSTQIHHVYKYRYYFPLKDIPADSSLIIIDEASMVSDEQSNSEILKFGSGRLLSDLLKFCRLDKNHPGYTSKSKTRILFIGDPLQLPPINQNFSPALEKKYLEERHKLKVVTFELTEVMRQKHGGEILDAATKIRKALNTNNLTQFKLPDKDRQIKTISREKALDLVVDAYHDNQYLSLIAYTNKHVLTLNRLVRQRLFGDPDVPVSKGDFLIVHKNNSDLYNGDLIKVIDADRNTETKNIYLKGRKEPIQLIFRGAIIAFRDSENKIRKQEYLLLENLLQSEKALITPDENIALLVDFSQRHSNLKPNTKEYKQEIQTDPWFNALHVKYGYAMTCHKAQGGEFDTVIIDFSDRVDTKGSGFFQWAYTAITRAKKQLYTIDPPIFEHMKEEEWKQIKADRTKTESSTTDISLTKEADWLRYSFACGQESLYQNYKKIKLLLGDIQARIENIIHGQHFERYHIFCQGYFFDIQYWYKASGKISKISLIKTNCTSTNLINTIESTIEDALQADEKIQIPDFITPYLDKLKNADLKIDQIRSMPYRFRINMSDTTGGKKQSAAIDLLYNGKNQITRIEPLKNQQQSPELLEKLHGLLKT